MALLSRAILRPRSWLYVGLVVLAGAMSALRSHAALDSAGSWSADGPEQTAPSVHEDQSAAWSLWQSSITSDMLTRLEQDGESRIPEAFRVPEGLETQVRFWLQIYTRYTSREVVLFDEDHPELVYEVIDFRNLARTSRNRAAFEIVSRQVLKERVSAYQRAFVALAARGKGSRKKARSREESQILSVARGLPHQHGWLELKKGLRVQWGQRDQVMLGLQASAPYRARMDHVFESMGLPKELTLLSLVESSFNPKALSHAGAAGVWQFMPDSGAEFLQIQDQAGIDERVSPIKSTVAAARLLQRNKKMLGTWPAAISAYNHGHGKWLPVSGKDRSSPGRILAQCSKSKRMPTRLGFASKNYYAEFLALLRADRYQDRAFGPNIVIAGQPVRFVEVAVAERVEGLAQLHGLAPGALMGLNPDILASKGPVPAGFLLAVPATEDDFSAVIKATAMRERRFRTARSGPRSPRKGSLQAAATVSRRSRKG